MNLLREFEKPATGNIDLPPVADIERDDGGNDGGEYWVGPNGRIVIPKNQYGGSDHTQMLYTNPEAFGMTWDDVLSAIAAEGGDDRVISWLQRWKENGTAGTHSSAYSASSPDSTAGGRTRAQSILFRKGWIMVGYHPPQSFEVWGSFQGIGKDIDYAMDHFPIMRCDTIDLHLYDTETGDWSHRSGATFHKEDYPGFAGHVGAMISWLHGEKVPPAHWLYIKAGQKVEQGYLHLQRSGQKGYFLPYVGETQGRNLRDRGNYIRIASSQVQGLKSDYSQVHGMILYSEHPFALPSPVQTWNGRHWQAES